MKKIFWILLIIPKLKISRRKNVQDKISNYSLDHPFFLFLFNIISVKFILQIILYLNQ